MSATLSEAPAAGQLMRRDLHPELQLRVEIRRGHAPARIVPVV